MIPVAFDYLRPRTLAEASNALAASAGHAVNSVRRAKLDDRLEA